MYFKEVIERIKYEGYTIKELYALAGGGDGGSEGDGSGSDGGYGNADGGWGDDPGYGGSHPSMGGENDYEDRDSDGNMYDKPSSGGHGSIVNIPPPPPPPQWSPISSIDGDRLEIKLPSSEEIASLGAGTTKRKKTKSVSKEPLTSTAATTGVQI